MLSAGVLIWTSVKPLLKMAITTGFGIALTKNDLFSGVAARGAGQVIVNITLPSLLFSKIVPSFTSANIRELGPLLLIGFIYQGLGLVLSLIIRQFFWVPHRFRYGILAAGTWGNWGDIPTAVITSITSAAPFNGTTDSNLAVAYIAVFILVFYITLFPLGGHLMIAKDFEGPDLTDDEVRESFMVKARRTGRTLASSPSAIAAFFRRRSSSCKDASEISQLEKAPSTLDTQADQDEKAEPREVFSPPETLIEADHFWAGGSPSGVERRTHTTSAAEDPKITGDELDGGLIKTASLPFTAAGYVGTSSGHKSIITGEEMNRRTSRGNCPECHLPTVYDDAQPSNVHPTQQSINQVQPTYRPSVAQRILRFIRLFNTPPTISIILSFPIALVPRLKGLFVPLPNSPHGPDGLPPLAFLLDTATFIGAASVPLGLICLGSALARLNVPKPWTRLPLGAIGMFTVMKLFLMPVLGVLICELFTHGIPLFNPNDKVLRFVCIFFSSVPTATTQVFLTQLHSPDGNAEHLSAFLVPQYALMFFSMTSLNAYTLFTLYS
ncbi:Protein M3 [Tulasnella sp. 330]|nr:Protein M3 [Tulasnella sp. 330]KAG8871705.1 Protein M3 [Tulasnella sp. 331]KAG8874066.1 Protein M3 [Tulasnella sp. 332]